MDAGEAYGKRAKLDLNKDDEGKVGGEMEGPGGGESSGKNGGRGAEENQRVVKVEEEKVQVVTISDSSSEDGEEIERDNGHWGRFPQGSCLANEKGSSMVISRFFGFGAAAQKLECVADVPPPPGRVHVQRWSPSPPGQLESPESIGERGAGDHEGDEIALAPVKRHGYDKVIALYDSQWIRARHKVPIGRRPVQIESSGWLIPRHKLSLEPVPGSIKSQKSACLRAERSRHTVQGAHDDVPSSPDSDGPENPRPYNPDLTSSESSDSCPSDSNDLYA